MRGSGEDYKMRVMAVCGFSFTLACIICLNIGLTFSIILAAVCLLICAILAVLHKRFSDRSIITALFCIMFAGIMCSICLKYSVEPAKKLDNKTVYIEAVSVELPEIHDGYAEYVFETENIDKKEQNVKFKAYFSEDIGAEPYDKISGNFKFRLNENSRTFDWAEGVMLTAYSGEYKIEKADDKPLRYSLLMFRKLLKDGVYDNADSDTASLITALTLGDKSGLRSDTLSDFRALGISHIASVSGMHVAVISLALTYLLMLFGVSYKKRIIISAVAVIMYLFTVGFVFSAVRSGIMIIIVLLSKFIRRDADPINSLGLACFALTVFNPYTALNIGFLLSATATLGMILTFPVSQKIIRKILPFENRFCSTVRSLLIPLFQSIAAMIFTLPVIYISFGTLSLVSPIANLICDPIATVLICMSMLLVATLFLPFVPSIIGYLCSFPAKALYSVSGKMADLFGSAVGIASESFGIWIAVCLAVFAVCSFVIAYHSESRAKILKIGAFLCAVSLAITSVGSYVLNKDVTEMRLLCSDKGVCAAFKKNNEMVVCGIPKDTAYDLQSHISKSGARSVRAAVFPALSNDYYKYASYIRTINAEVSIAPKNSDKFYELPNAKAAVGKFSDLMNNTCFEFKAESLKVTVGNTSVLFLSKNSVISALDKDFLTCDIVIMPPTPPSGTDRIKAKAAFVCFDEKNSVPVRRTAAICSEKVYSAENGIDLTVRINKDGKYTVLIDK